MSREPEMRLGVRRCLSIGMAVSMAWLVGCGDSPQPTRASQTAARVNRAEVTVHQINHVLEQQRGLRADQLDVVSRQVLERLIDQQLAVERAGELKIDRDPKVLLQLEAARSAIIARAYLERVGEAASRPTPEETRQYYDDHPALFRERRLFDLQELAVEATPHQVPALRARLGDKPNTDEYVAWLRSSGYKVSIHRAVRAPEQLPPASLKAITALLDGQPHFNPVSNGVQILIRVGSTPQPLALEQATPAIQETLLGARKRELMQRDIQALRSRAKIDYVGRFAESPPPAVHAAASGVSVEVQQEAAK